MAGRPQGTAGRRASGVKLVRSLGARRWAVMVAAVVVLLIIVAVLIATPPLSRPLAERLAEAWLRQHGADASIEVTALSDTAMTARVRLGDRRDPDLTIDRLDVVYTLSGPWTGRALDFTPRAVRLVRPRLRARLRNGAIDLGQLAGLVEWARRRPPTRQPLPDITIVDGQARLATPGGVLAVTGDGAYADRRTLVFNGRLAPFRLVLGRASVSGEGGVLEVIRRGPRLAAKAELRAGRLQRGADTMRVTALGLQSDLPWPGRPDRLAGAASLRLSVQGLAGVWGGARLADAAVTAGVDGAVDATGERQRLAGALTAAIRTVAAEGSRARIAGLAMGAALPRLDLAHDAGSFSARSRGTLTLSLDRLTVPVGAGAGLSAAATLTDGTVALEHGAWSGRATLVGRAAGRGGVSAPLVRRLAGGLPLVAGTRPYAGALGSALKDMRFTAPQWRLDIDGRRTRFALAAPARLDAASGAALVLSGQGELAAARGWRAQGAGAVAVSGGGLPSLSLQASDLVAGPDGLEATLRGRGAFDTAFAKGADAEALGRLVLAKGRLRVDLLGCSPLKAERLAAGGYAAKDVSLRVCPGPAPLVEASARRWRASGRVEGLRGDDADLTLRLRDTNAAFNVDGGVTGIGEARLTLASATVVDLASPARFSPLAVEGELRGGAEAWRGAFTVSDRAKRPLARLTVAASAGGLGRLEVDMGQTFSSGVLQPADLTPFAAGAREVAGQVAFKGWFEWGAAGRERSGGELIVRDLGLTGPTGPVTKLDTHVVFTSLSPLVTAPDQELTVAQVASLTPLTKLDVVFDLNDDTLNLRRVRGDLAGGQVSLAPTRVDLRPGSRFDGVLLVHRIDLGEVLAATSLADQVKLQAIVDGQIPFSVGPWGITIQQGVMSSVGGGRLSISRTALGAPAARAQAAQGGVAQDFAYQALENLAFESLDARLNTLPKDRLGVIFHIKGRHDPPQRQRAVIRLADAMRGRMMDRPIALPSDTRIDLTLDTSLNFGELVQALAAAWRDAIRPATIHSVSAAPGSASSFTGSSSHP
ncbi:MAG TPA: YdbH domain-containing protein [Caulobacteraceae bacterium]|nr:YdbH domain-containing protein [Caulobacteraceae bacterium]